MKIIIGEIAWKENGAKKKKIFTKWYHHPMTIATALANPNLAFIKDWVNSD